jgi:hypothetical protein
MVVIAPKTSTRTELQYNMFPVYKHIADFLDSLIRTHAELRDSAQKRAVIQKNSNFLKNVFKAKNTREFNEAKSQVASDSAIPSKEVTSKPPTSNKPFEWIIFRETILATQEKKTKDEISSFCRDLNGELDILNASIQCFPADTNIHNCDDFKELLAKKIAKEILFESLVCSSSDDISKLEELMRYPFSNKPNQDKSFRALIFRELTTFMKERELDVKKLEMAIKLYNASRSPSLAS